MTCPKCGHPRSEVETIDARRHGRERKRYRICLNAICGYRFTTLEIYTHLLRRTPTGSSSTTNQP